MRTTGNGVFLGLGIAALLAPLFVAAMAQTVTIVRRAFGDMALVTE